MTTFSDLGLPAPILKALAAEGYETPTPIQAGAIPHVLAGRDLLGLAQTGTGKTAAFALPILSRLAQDGHRPQQRACRVLVLSPTRELASQIEASITAYGRFMHLSSTLVFGGVPIGRQIRACARGVDIVVATPGRLLDLLNQRALTLGDVEIFVLDEADRMLDLGFMPDIRRIVSQLPRERQSLFFSATMPPAIDKLAGALLHDPVQVKVAPPSATADRIAQSVLLCPNRDKQAMLHGLLKNPAIARALVFARTKHGADRVVKHLNAAGFPADAIHGNKSQGQRERALAAFRGGQSRLLVATDIAARGIDVDGVTHVINFDLPNVPETYVHRIGRTARAGAEGAAISLVGEDERGYLRDIERLIRQSVPVVGGTPGAIVAPAPSVETKNRPMNRNAPQRPGRRPDRHAAEPVRPDHRRGEPQDARRPQPERRREGVAPVASPRPGRDRPGDNRRAYQPR